MSRTALFLGVCCVTRSVVLAQRESPTTSPGDEFMVNFPFLAITGLGVLVVLFLAINWVCFVVCVCKNSNMQYDMEKAQQRRINRERQFKEDLRAFVDNEVARKLHGRGMSSSGLQRTQQRPAHPDDQHAAVQGLPPSEERFQLALKISRQEARALPKVDNSERSQHHRVSRHMQEWPKDAPLRPLPRVHAGQSRQDLMGTPPRYSDIVDNNPQTSPWSFQGSPPHPGAALEQLRSWPQFV